MADVGGEQTSTLSLRASPTQVVAARRFVRRSLGDSIPASVSRDLQLIMSELFTNAVLFGTGPRVRVTVSRTANFAGVSVDSPGRAQEVGSITEWRVAEPEAIVGRGLGIVRQLADEIAVERGDDHFAVTARRQIRERSDA